MADISLITGNLTVLGSTTLSGIAFLPSGYTNNACVPSSPITRYLLSNGTESTIPFGGGGAFATGFKFGWGFSTPADLNRHINTQKWYIVTGSSVPGRIQGNNTIQINKTGVIIPFPNPAPPAFFSQGILTSYTIDERFNHIEQSGVFALQSAQKIGFGTFDPQEKVHVSNGNLRVDNTGIITSITGTNANISNINSTNGNISNITGTSINVQNINSNKFILQNSYVPSTSTSPGTSGQIATDSNYFYSYDGSKWKRTALSEW
jgi:hypothetical protein